MGSLKLTTASSGSVILSPANTASDVTITVPAVTGTMLTNKTAGTVLQVVQTFSQIGQNSTTSTSFVASPLTASITPSSSSSKILVISSFVGLISSTSYVSAYTIYRNSTNLGSSVGLATASTPQDSSVVMQVLDSPATTSSTTYTVYFRVNGGTGYVGDTLGGISPYSAITLMEISA